MEETSVPIDQLEWERRRPASITGDPIWQLQAYRAALFLLDHARADIRTGAKRGLYADNAAQLLDSVASVSAHISEGYSRATRADRLRFFGYGLGSLREAVSWYLAATDHLPPGAAEHRLELIAQIRRLLLGLIRSTRARGPRRSELEP